ncbi:MAG: hypothetical protein HQ557_10735 [Bacteroidetes bacterium]|nr:hypothetical protein [Bacteroidota bacterium]
MDNTIILETQEWLDSPCSTCGGTYCCSYLPLCDLTVETHSEMLLAADLCWFEGMVPILMDNGQWRLYYHSDCRFLDKQTLKCSIHDTPEQTGICRTYSPHSCWYKKAFATAETDLLIRFNGARLEKLIAMTVFDEEGIVLDTPSWDDIQRELREIPYTQAAISAHQQIMEHVVQVKSVFLLPPGRPQKPDHLDLIKFRLGFPGMMVMISASLWCFALPALVKHQMPKKFKDILLRRLNRGEYDDIFDGISDQERRHFRKGAFQRVTQYESIQEFSGIVPVLPVLNNSKTLEC